MDAFAYSVKSWLNAALGLVYPEVCQLCGGARATPAEGYVCGGCRAKARFIEPPYCLRCGRPYEGDISTLFECATCRAEEWDFESARSAVVARDPVLEVIHRYKHLRREGLCFDFRRIGEFLTRTMTTIMTHNTDCTRWPDPQDALAATRHAKPSS